MGFKLSFCSSSCALRTERTTASLCKFFERNSRLTWRFFSTKERNPFFAPVKMVHMFEQLRIGFKEGKQQAFLVVFIIFNQKLGHGLQRKNGLCNFSDGGFKFGVVKMVNQEIIEQFFRKVIRFCAFAARKVHGEVFAWIGQTIGQAGVLIRNQANLYESWHLGNFGSAYQGISRYPKIHDSDGS